MKGRQSGMPDEEYWGSFFNVACILDKLDCCHGCGDVLEFGCGYGLFTEEAARRSSGSVFAVDIEPKMILATRRRMQRAALPNVVLAQRDFLVEGCGCDDQSVAYAMLFNILHVENPVALLRETHRVLKPGGKAAILHWNYDPSTPRGPSMDIRPRPEDCRTWAEKAGLQFIRSEPLACCPYHYGLVVGRPISAD